MSDADIIDDPIATYEREMRGMNVNTLSSHLSRARRFDDWLGEGRTVLDATPDDVRDWLLDLDEQGYQGSTIKNYHTALKSFYDQFTDDEGDGTDLGVPSVLGSNPARFDFDTHLSSITTTPKKQQVADNDEGIIYLEPDEIRKLRRHVPRPKVRNELIIKMFIQTGMRASELANLTLGRLKCDLKQVEVRDTKNDKTRTVPYDDLDPELSMWLDEGYRDRFSRADESDYVFLTRESPKMSESQIGRMVRTAADNAGIQEEWGEDAAGRTKRRVTTHSLRSTFVMRLFQDSNLSAPEIQKMTGHTRLETLNEYANAARSDVEDAYRDADVDWGT